MANFNDANGGKQQSIIAGILMMQMEVKNKEIELVLENTVRRYSCYSHNLDHFYMKS